MASQLEEGTLTATASEQILNTTTPQTADGAWQFLVNCQNMVSGDTLEIRIKEKTLAVGTQRLVYLDTLIGTQTAPVWVSPAIILLHGWDITLVQTSGAGFRNFPWSIRQA